MVKLVKVWQNKSASNSTKLRLIGALVWPLATYGWEAWMLRKQEPTRIQAFENKCIGKMMRISWTKMMTNESRFMSWQMPEAYCWNTFVHFTLDTSWDNHGTIFRAAWWQVLLKESEVTEDREYLGWTTFWWGLMSGDRRSLECWSIHVANCREATTAFWHDIKNYLQYTTAWQCMKEGTHSNPKHAVGC